MQSVLTHLYTFLIIFRFATAELKITSNFNFDQFYVDNPPEDLPLSTSWPLKAGFPGLVIKNLNEYLSPFPKCLTVVQNFQGIEMMEWKFPIYLVRFDRAAGIDQIGTFYPNKVVNFTNVWEIPFERISSSPMIPEEVRQISSYQRAYHLHEAKWNCYAQFDLFYPEPSDSFLFYRTFVPINIVGKYYIGKLCDKKATKRV